MENLAIESFWTIWALGWAAMTSILWWVWSSIWCWIAGQAAAWVTAEKPELFGKAMVLEALPWSQGIYGLIWAFIIIKILPVFELTTIQGISVFLASLPLALSAFFSALFQGKVSTAWMNIIAKNPEWFGSAMILAAIVETFAILWLLVTILALFDIKATVA